MGKLLKTLRDRLHNTVLTKNGKLFTRFSRSFTRQCRFGGLKTQTFENRFEKSVSLQSDIALPLAIKMSQSVILSWKIACVNHV